MCKNSPIFDHITRENFIFTTSVIPIVYGQAKIHKQGAPYRIIISGRQHPTNSLSKWLAKRQNAYNNKSEYTVMNSLNVKQQIVSRVIAHAINMASIDALHRLAAETIKTDRN